MKILLLGTDEKVFEENSPVRKRLESYSDLVDKLVSIVLVNNPKESIQKGNLTIVPIVKNGKIKSLYSLYRTAALFKDIDLVSTQDPSFLGILGYFVSKEIRAKLHVQIHTDIASRKYTKSKRGFVEWVVARFVIKKANGVRVVSKKVEENIKERLKIKKHFSVLPVYVSLEREHVFNDLEKNKLDNFVKNHEINILIMCRLEKEKRVKESVHIFERILKTGHNTGLVIVGSGREKDSIKKTIKKNNLSQNIILFEWTQNPELFFEKCDLFWNNSIFEGFGMSIVESVLYGLPVLTTNVGVANDVVKNGINGYVYEVSDKKKLHVLLEDMIHNPENIHNMKNKKIALPDSFMYDSVNEYAKKIVSDWENTIKNEK